MRILRPVQALHFCGRKNRTLISSCNKKTCLPSKFALVERDCTRSLVAQFTATFPWMRRALGIKGLSSSFDRGLQEAATYPTHDPVTPPPLHIPSSGALTIIGSNRGVRRHSKILRRDNKAFTVIKHLFLNFLKTLPTLYRALFWNIINYPNLLKYKFNKISGRLIISYVIYVVGCSF
jgi:hypothetical protein